MGSYEATGPPDRIDSAKGATGAWCPGKLGSNRLGAFRSWLSLRQTGSTCSWGIIFLAKHAFAAFWDARSCSSSNVTNFREGARGGAGRGFHRRGGPIRRFGFTVGEVAGGVLHFPVQTLAACCSWAPSSSACVRLETAAGRALRRTAPAGVEALLLESWFKTLLARFHIMFNTKFCDQILSGRAALGVHRSQRAASDDSELARRAIITHGRADGVFRADLGCRRSSSLAVVFLVVTKVLLGSCCYAEPLSIFLGKGGLWPAGGARARPVPHADETEPRRELVRLERAPRRE